MPSSQPAPFRTRPGSAGRPSLLLPETDHDSCGVGFVATLDRRPSRRVVDLGLTALRRLQHRGAVGADATTGDGAGVMLEVPHQMLARLASEAGFTLPNPGDYALGAFFLPRDGADRATCRALVDLEVARAGLVSVWWREVPCRPTAAGVIARGGRPAIWQLVVGIGGPGLPLEDRLYPLRRRIELGVARQPLADPASRQLFAVASLSSRTVVYKGQLTGSQLPRFYPDLKDPGLESRMLVFHQRFSTNTEPNWRLAQPFRLIAHNGEINTVRGNRNWMRARAGSWRHPVCGVPARALGPILDPGGSDSADFDRAVELLVRSGRSLPQALLMMIPEAWEEVPDLSAALRDFYAYHANLLEPWDGPAALAFSDGRIVGAALDRNGLRPARYVISRDGLVVVASEAGVVDVPWAQIEELGRLHPGQVLAVDLDRGAVVRDREIKREVAGRAPWGRWERERVTRMPGLGPQAGTAELPLPTLDDLQPAHRRFGYTEEDLQEGLAPAAAHGHEPVASMGNDTPPAVLSARPHLLFDYFSQGFAQVTNPPLDHIRERRVMSLRATLGPGGDLLAPDPAVARRVEMASPVLSDVQLAWIRNRRLSGLACRTLSIGFPLEGGEEELEAALHRLARQADRAVRERVRVLILSDRELSAGEAPIPSLLALGCVHQHLVRKGRRTSLSLVVESGEPRNPHHVACLTGHGAEAVNPYLALATAAAMASSGQLETELTREQARESFRRSLEEGLLKVMSKMGISTFASYCGAQVFEALGLAPGVVQLCFSGTPSRVGGVGFGPLARGARARERQARTAAGLELGGSHRWRVGEEGHAWGPEAVAALQHSVRQGSQASFERFRRLADAESGPPVLIRHLLHPAPAAPVPLEEVEPASAIVRHFVTGAMSLGSLGPEAHRTIALAMNHLGAKSNTGEGGEDPERYRDQSGPWSSRSAIKQVASARFGVTIDYLVNADDLQIKISQGAKPGEGGQLPGHKVDRAIARLRHASAGQELISPPPHHDIYSIEDLAQLIWDLKQANPTARVSVKLVSAPGVGQVAAGVVKARADHITISGQEGGTGAAPLTSIKHAGLPWELGLAETQQALFRQGLRSRVVLQVDGGLRTGRDVVVAAMLGAEEFGFGTAALVAAGCVLMRVCHLNTCPVGVATQDPELRRRFAGAPEHLIRYFLMVAEDARRWLADLGWRRLEEAVGRADRLTWVPAAGLDLAPLIQPPTSYVASRLRGRRRVQALALSRSGGQEHSLHEALDARVMARLGDRLFRGEPVEVRLPVRNSDRAVGARISGEVARIHGSLPEATIHLRLSGTAGQSLGAWLAAGVAITCVGTTNDYPGKGLSGGRLAVTPPVRLRRAGQVVAGNVALYGATSGQAFFCGQAGERFAVRNSGAVAVVEGVGDHGCEYMTKGVVVVLGRVGRNFGAGMTGGVAFLIGADHHYSNLDRRAVGAGAPETGELELVHDLLERHRRHTGSPRAAELLADWPRSGRLVVAVRPLGTARAAERAVGADRLRSLAAG